MRERKHLTFKQESDQAGKPQWKARYEDEEHREVVAVIESTCPVEPEADGDTFECVLGRFISPPDDERGGMVLVTLLMPEEEPLIGQRYYVTFVWVSARNRYECRIETDGITLTLVPWGYNEAALGAFLDEDPERACTIHSIARMQEDRSYALVNVSFDDLPVPVRIKK